eukprot:Lithocolla_globosa_v1_NODE_193_length_5322_cov_12.601179.p2 type:complete len:268 gc:universal NODE_193_length_5322_cov_12.601179:4283-5086(+)
MVHAEGSSYARYYCFGSMFEGGSCGTIAHVAASYGDLPILMVLGEVGCLDLQQKTGDKFEPEDCRNLTVCDIAMKKSHQDIVNYCFPMSFPYDRRKQDAQDHLNMIAVELKNMIISESELNKYLPPRCFPECDNCEDESMKKANVFCSSCDLCLCENCWEIVHSAKVFRHHSKEGLECKYPCNEEDMLQLCLTFSDLLLRGKRRCEHLREQVTNLESLLKKANILFAFIQKEKCSATFVTALQTEAWKLSQNIQDQLPVFQSPDAEM